MTLIETAGSIAADVAAAARTAEDARQLPAATSDRIRDAGLYRMLMPATLGGAEAHPQDYFDVSECIAAADASAGWCTMISASTAYLSAFLETGVARGLYADPACVASGVFAPMGKATRTAEGYRVSGHWRWNSNGRNSTLLCGGSLIFDDGKLRTFENGAPDHRMMIFSAVDAEFIDTWHTAGLKGTGSGDFTLTGLDVPAAQSVSLFTDAPVATAPLYLFPAFGLLALGIAAVASGNARAALNELRTLASTKSTPGSKRKLAERATVQTRFAEADARLSAARALLVDCIGDAFEEARTKGVIAPGAKARLRLACTHMTRTAANACRAAHDMGGGDAVFLDHPLQRRLRDAETMTAHIMVAPATYEVTGRAALGLPIDDLGL